MKEPLDAGVLTIFGITGDLSARKLLPAVYQLLVHQLLPDHFEILGLSRRDVVMDDLISSLRGHLVESKVEVDEAIMTKLEGLISLVKIDYSNPDDYQQLKQRIEEHEATLGTCLNRLFYLAIPAQAFGDIIDGLGAAGLNQGCTEHSGESRLLIEKPFGSDLESAKALIKRLEATFTNEQIYRIDHYLAKETAQNILTFRFQNPLFRAVWDGKLIDHITLTAAEQIGIEHRADFYDQTGALRDLLQSHLLQLLSLVIMDEPRELNSEGIHAAKLAALRAVRPPKPADMATKAVRGRYEGYLEESDNPQSTTETFVAVELAIDNDIWRNTPVYIRTGKALAEKVTEITVAFRQDDNQLADANTLTIRIQPNEGIELSLVAKKPGLAYETQRVPMEFSYQTAFDSSQPDAYERVLADAFRGDQTLFATSAEVIASWETVQPILDAWAASTTPPETYVKGSWGPDSAQTLIEQSGAQWPSATS